jgi:hypothetical protein
MLSLLLARGCGIPIDITGLLLASREDNPHEAEIEAEVEVVNDKDTERVVEDNNVSGVRENLATNQCNEPPVTVAEIIDDVETCRACTLADDDNYSNVSMDSFPALSANIIPLGGKLNFYDTEEQLADEFGLFNISDKMCDIGTLDDGICAPQYARGGSICIPYIQPSCDLMPLKFWEVEDVQEDCPAEEQHDDKDDGDDDDDDDHIAETLVLLPAVDMSSSTGNSRNGGSSECDGATENAVVLKPATEKEPHRTYPASSRQDHWSSRCSDGRLPLYVHGKHPAAHDNRKFTEEGNRIKSAKEAVIVERRTEELNKVPPFVLMSKGS